MMLIAFTLIARLFGQSQPAGVTPRCARLAAQAPVVVIVQPGQLHATVVDALVRETAAIWKSMGVAVRSEMPRTSSEPVQIISVVVTEAKVGGAVGLEPLGWILFESGEAEAVIHLSRLAALDLLDRQPGLTDRPAPYRDVLLARVMGRALAHELGHYLLRCKAHSSSGLMRASWPLTALLDVDRSAFTLDCAPTRGVCACDGGRPSRSHLQE